MSARIGNGFDVHALVAGRRLVLGGVTIPYPQGLDGHSDADVLLHAIGDALLGALALGDLGRHFPASDPQWKDADSRTLLRHVARMVLAAGWTIGNVDATVIAEAPRLAPYAGDMAQNIAQDLACGAAQVSVKATTTERLGFAGRGEGIAAIATVLLLQAEREAAGLASIVAPAEIGDKAQMATLAPAANYPSLVAAALPAAGDRLGR